MLISEHSSDFLNYLSYLSHCDRGKESFEIHAWMLKTLLSEVDRHPFLHYIIAASYGKMIHRMQNPNSITYYNCLQNSDGQGFGKPQGSGVRVTRVRVRVRIFIPLQNPYP